MSLEECPQLSMQREWKRNDPKQEIAFRYSLLLSVTLTSPGGWAGLELPVDFMSHCIFQGSQASRMMTPIFELRDQYRMKASLPVLSIRRLRLLSSVYGKAFKIHTFLLVFTSSHPPPPQLLQDSLLGLEREVASEPSQNAWMKNEVIQSIIHMLGLHAKHLDIWKQLDN